MMLSAQSACSCVTEENEQAPPISETYCFETSLSVIIQSYIFKKESYF